MANKKGTEQIKVQILSTTPTSFFIKNEDSIDKVEIAPENVKFQINIDGTTMLEQKQIRIEVDVKCLWKKESKAGTNEMFGIISSTLFSIPELDKLYDDDENYTASPQFERKLLNICIGVTRGMLAANTANTPFKNITMPLIDIGTLERKSKPIK